MVAADTKIANGSNAEAKPGAGQDHATDKKVAANAIADPNKLHSDSYSKPTDKPAAAKPADKPAPAAAKPAEKPVPVGAKPAEKPQEQPGQGLWGWISGTEKSAEDALNSAKKYVKAEVNSAVAVAEKVSHTAVAVTETVITAAVAPALVPVVAEAAFKPAAKPAKAGDAPATPASSQAAPASAPPADAVAAVESTAGWLFSKAVDYAKQGLSSFIGSPTETALLAAAVLAPTPVGIVAAAAAGSAYALPEMVGYAGVAVKSFEDNFGDEKHFAAVAEHVTDIDHIPTNTDSGKSDQVNIERARRFAADAAKQAGITWMIPGDGKPGGATSIVSKDGQIEAKGMSPSGIPVEAQTAPGKYKVTAGDVTGMQADGISTMADKAWDIQKNGDLITARLKGSDNYTVFNTKTHEYRVYNAATHESNNFTPDGAVSTFGPDGQLMQTKGDANEASKKEAADAHTTKYYIDGQGNMAAITSDGIRYNFYAKENRMEIHKDGKVLKLNTANGEVRLYSEDPKTHALTVLPVDAAHLPKGWVLLANGSVNINGGAFLANKGEHKFHIGATSFDLITKTLERLEPNGPKVQALGDKTVLTGANNQTQTTVPAKGDITQTLKGKLVVSYDPASNTMQEIAPTGEKLSFKTNGVTSLEETNKQITTMDAQGNITSRDKDNRELFTLNQDGDIHLYDNTTISHTGAVYNPDRNISEAASKSQSASELVKDAAAKAESLAAMANIPGGLDASIASLQSILAALNGLGDVPELAEQIGAAKATVEAKLAAAESKEGLNLQLFHAGLNDSQIEKAFALRESGTTDGQIVANVTQPQNAPVGAVA